MILKLGLTLTFFIVGPPSNRAWAESQPVPSKQATPAQQLQTAIQLYRQKKYVEAQPLLERLVQAYPDNDKVQYYLASVSLATRQLDRAGALYSKIKTDDPELRVRALLGASRVYRFQKKWVELVQTLRRMDDPGTRPELTRAIKREVSEAQKSLVAEGITHFEGDRYSTALDYFRASLLLADDPDSLMMAGVANYRLSNRAQAKLYFERILELNEASAYWAQSEDFLNLLQNNKTRIGFHSPFAELRLDSGYNSNYLLSDWSTPPLRAWETILSAGLGSQVFSSGTFGASLNYLLNFDEFIGKPKDRLISQEFALNMGSRQPRWIWSGGINTSHVISGNQPILLKPSARLRGEKIFGRQRFGLTLNVARSIPLISTYAWIAGPSYSVQPDWSSEFKSGRSRIGLSFGKDLLGDHDGNSTSGIPRTKTTWSIFGSYRHFLSERWTLNTSTSFSRQSYVKLASSAPRTDRVLYLSTSGEYNFNSNWTLGATADHSTTFSTYSDPNIYDARTRKWGLMGFVSWNI